MGILKGRKGTETDVNLLLAIMGWPTSFPSSFVRCQRPYRRARKRKRPTQAQPPLGKPRVIHQLFQLEWKCFMSKCFLSSMNPVDAFLLNACFFLDGCMWPSQEWLELKERFSFIRSRSSSLSVWTNPVRESCDRISCFRLCWRSRRRWSQGISLFFNHVLKDSQSMLEL